MLEYSVLGMGLSSVALGVVFCIVNMRKKKMNDTTCSKLDALIEQKRMNDEEIHTKLDEAIDELFEMNDSLHNTLKEFKLQFPSKEEETEDDEQ
jgi:hypothetical protein